MKTESYQTRLNRIKGQIEGIEKMLTSERQCADVITQIQAVRASLAALGEELLKNEALDCLDSHSEKERQKRFGALVRNLFKLS